MAETIKLGWLHDIDEIKFAPHTLASQVYLNDGANGTVNSKLNTHETNISEISTELSTFVKNINPTATGVVSFGRKSGTTTGENSVAIGTNVTAMGARNIGIGQAASAGGNDSIAIGTAAAASPSGANNIGIGNLASASGDNAIAMGTGPLASGNDSIALGTAATASGKLSVAIGAHNVSSGEYATSLGCWTESAGVAGTTIGNATQTAENSWGALASGIGSIAKGKGQHVFGEWNTPDVDVETYNERSTYAMIFGNGTSDTSRSNMATLDWDGSLRVAGDIYTNSTCGNYSDTTAQKLATCNWVQNDAKVQNSVNADKFASAQLVGLTGDVTGAVVSNAGWEIETALANSGVPAGKYGGASSSTGNISEYGSDFTPGSKIPFPIFTVDEKGRITEAGCSQIKLPENASISKAGFMSANDKSKLDKIMIVTFTANSDGDVFANQSVSNIAEAIETGNIVFGVVYAGPNSGEEDLVMRIGGFIGESSLAMGDTLTVQFSNSDFEISGTVSDINNESTSTSWTINQKEPATTTIYKYGNTAPSDTKQLWVNSADNTLNFYNGSEWLPITGTFTG